jgi:nitroreductase
MFCRDSDKMNLSVSAAVAQRQSVRAFLPDPIPNDALRDILSRAFRAPSGTNLQPWQIYVLNGASMTRFRALMAQRMSIAPQGEGFAYPICPEPLPEPYLARRIELIGLMYQGWGITREDQAGRLGMLHANASFFGAPAGLFCFIDRLMGPPQWSDLGMYLQTVMLLCEEAGYSTCAQEFWSVWQETVRNFVNAPAAQMLFCGMAIGRADCAAAVNQFRSPRAPLADVLHFV